MILEIAVGLLSIAVVWLAFTLMATRRDLAGLKNRPARHPTTIKAEDTDGLEMPILVVVVRPSCPSCLTALTELRGTRDFAMQGTTTVISASNEMTQSHRDVRFAPRLATSLRVPAYPWVAALDSRLRVTEFEPYVSVARLQEIESTLVSNPDRIERGA